MFFGEITSHSNLSEAAYNENNSRVFAFLSEAFNEFIHSQTLRPFSRHRDGRLAFQALVKFKLVSSTWEEEIERVENMVIALQWNGRSAIIPLRKHITNHRIAQNMMERALYHVSYTSPDETTRVAN